MDDSKFAKPSGLTGDWVTQSQLHFWHDDNPFAVKQLIEKMTRFLLQREAAAEGLAYAGGTPSYPEPRAVRLVFEAVIGGRKLYGLTIVSTSARNWVTEENHLKAHNRVTAFWSGKLQVTQDFDVSAASQAAFEECKRESIALEAVPVEDPAPIQAVQKEILAALRAGKEFRTAHHEGGTQLFFDGKAFVRSDYGEDPKTETFAGDAAMIACLRSFYDWEARRDTHPNKPPELAIWKYIQNQLR
jgi:hypothetical protein